MSLVKETTFYDEHPFDWFESYRGEERRKVDQSEFLYQFE